MPDRERVQAFIATVERGEYVEAIERFYAENASMQENGGEPRVGRDTLVAGERAMLGRVTAIRTLPVERWLVDGDRVVINWVFEITDVEGKVKRMDELALQEWRGDRIVRERFYYDPASIA
jgi:ketosteroid isomerase-like protein